MGSVKPRHPNFSQYSTAVNPLVTVARHATSYELQHRRRCDGLQETLGVEFGVYGFAALS